jgi:GMP reductase
MNEVQLDYSDVLIRPRASGMTSRSEVDVYSHHKCLWARTPGGDAVTINTIPLIAANMTGVGEIRVAEVLSDLGAMCVLKKWISPQELINFFDHADDETRQTRRNHVMMCVGTSDEDHSLFRTVYEQAPIKMLCIDVANGYLDRLVDVVQMYRRLYPQLVITAGNVCTAEQTQTLLRAGADIVKLGIGPGSVCTTRIETGVGRPQFSTVLECAEWAHAIGGLCIADGGCSTTGDVAKAFLAGADFVMLGGMFAGHKEGGGETITRVFDTGERTLDTDGELKPILRSEFFVRFYGSSSDAARGEQGSDLSSYSCSEGRDVEVPFRGWIHTTLANTLGGLRSTCTYVGAPSIQAIARSSTWYEVKHTHNKIYEGGG